MSTFRRRSKLGLLVCLCSLVAVNVVTFAAGDDADVPDRPIKSRSIRSPGDDVIWDCLFQNVTLDLDGVPLIEIVDLLREKFSINIQLDTPTFTSEGITGQEELSLTITDVPLRSALNRLLKDVGGNECSYVVRDNVLLLTTKNTADQIDLQRSYRILPLTEAGVTESQIQELVAFAISDREEEWHPVGNGSYETAPIRISSMGGPHIKRELYGVFMSEKCLLLRQTQSGHEKVEDVLNAYYAAVSE